MKITWSTNLSPLIICIIVIIAFCQTSQAIDDDVNNSNQMSNENLHEPTDAYIANLIRHNNLKRSWQSLQGSWGKRTGELNDDYNNRVYREENLDFGVPELPNPVNDDYDYSNIEKRAWKSMNGAWGKRVNSNWNNFRGKLF